MALNREQITNLNVSESLMQEYVVEAMQERHNAKVANKQLEAALEANDQLHTELAVLKQGSTDAPQADEPVPELEPEREPKDAANKSTRAR